MPEQEFDAQRAGQGPLPAHSSLSLRLHRHRAGIRLHDARDTGESKLCSMRKSKCDAQLPCSSCTLRGTQDSCSFPPKKQSSTNSRETPMPALSTHTISRAPSPTPYHPSKRTRINSVEDSPARPESSSSSSRRALAEINRLKESISHLEEHVRNISAGHDEDEGVGSLLPATKDEQRNWDKIKGLFPEKAVVEVMLEYAVIETPLYRIPVDASQLHFPLYTAARGFVTGVVSLEELELLQALTFYSIYFGQVGPLMECTRIALRVAISGGWFDESRDSWSDFTKDERARARRLVSSLIGTCKWQRLFLTPDPLGNVRVNVCRPDLSAARLDRPVKLDLPGRADLPFRVFRVRPTEELQRVAAYREIHTDIPLLISRARDYLFELQQTSSNPTPAQLESLLTHCDSVHREINHWRDVMLPRRGFPMFRPADIDLTSPTSAQHAAQSLVVYHAMGHIDATILRHWLDVDIGQIPQSPLHAHLHAECLANAERSMQSIPTLQALLSTRYAPFVTSFAAGNLFNAATCFAIPVLRAVHVWSSKSQEEDIRRLPAWPDDHEVGGVQLGKPGHALPADSARTTTTLPATIYIDSRIKTYANDILVILDVLSVLKASPLEAIAEARLATLIQKYGLRDSQAYPFNDATPPVAQTVPDAASFGVGQAMSSVINGNFGVDLDAYMSVDGMNPGQSAGYPVSGTSWGPGPGMDKTNHNANNNANANDDSNGNGNGQFDKQARPTSGPGGAGGTPASSENSAWARMGSGVGVGSGSLGHDQGQNRGQGQGFGQSAQPGGTSDGSAQGSAQGSGSNPVAQADEGFWSGPSTGDAPSSAFGIRGVPILPTPGVTGMSAGDQSFWDELFNVDPGFWEGLLNDTTGVDTGPGLGQA